MKRSPARHGVLVFSTLCIWTGLFGQSLADPPVHPVVFVEQADFCEHKPWQLVFEEQFDGDTLNTDRWLTFYPFCSEQDQCAASRSGFPEQIQISKDENVQLTGEGTVKLIGKRGEQSEWFGGSSSYSAGVLFSRQKFNRGRFECRCKVPLSTSHYLWPAFWLFGGDPRCSEIDILEILWDRSNTYHHSLHRYNYNCDGNHASDELTHDLGELSDDFHVYRADWDKWFVNFYLDEVLIYRSCRIYDVLNRPVSSCQVPEGIYIQNQAFPGQDAYLSIIVNLAIHKGFSNLFGYEPDIPNLPCALEVDYIRVYQR